MRKPLLILIMVCGGMLPAFAGRVLQDELQRTVTVPDHAHRLICLAPSITDVVYALGRGSDVVGITDFTQYPVEAKEKPSIGGVINPSLEKLVELKPDLVLAIAELNSSDLVRSIERLKIPVFVVHPQGVAGIHRSITSIGQAIDQQAEANALVARLREKEQKVRARVAGKKEPVVFLLIWADPIITAGRGAFITELIRMAGGVSVTEDLQSEWTRVSFETLVQRQPEYLLLVRGSPVTLESLRNTAGWNQLEAVRKGKVFYADDRINLPGPVAFEAMEDLARQFHP